MLGHRLWYGGASLSIRCLWVTFVDGGTNVFVFLSVGLFSVVFPVLWCRSRSGTRTHERVASWIGATQINIGLMQGSLRIENMQSYSLVDAGFRFQSLRWFDREDDDADSSVEEPMSALHRRDTVTRWNLTRVLADGFSVREVGSQNAIAAEANPQPIQPSQVENVTSSFSAASGLDPLPSFLSQVSLPRVWTIPLRKCVVCRMIVSVGRVCSVGLIPCGPFRWVRHQDFDISERCTS